MNSAHNIRKRAKKLEKKTQPIEIPKQILSDFARLVHIAVVYLENLDEKRWTTKEKQAYKFAKKFVNKYA